MCRLAQVWSAVAATIPIYALYALLFVDSGMSAAQVSGLFMIWSVVGIVAEVPSGAVADRFSRRGALVASGCLQAVGHATWIVAPTFAGFALGFVLWGLGGALSSGSFESLLYDGLAGSRAEERYARTLGVVESIGLVAQIPASLLAAALFAAGGYALAGWFSVAMCLVASGIALQFTDHRPAPPAAEPDEGGDGTDEEELGYFATLRAGFAAVRSTPPLRAATVAVALIYGLDASEEYFPLQVEQWGVGRTWVPLVVLTIPLGGAIGSAMTSAGSRLGPRALGLLLLIGAVLLAAAAWIAQPLAVAGIVLFYALYRHVLAVAEVRLQHEISSATRATTTSVAALGGELVGIAVFGVWALGGLPLLAAAVAFVAVVAIPLLGGRRLRQAHRSRRRRCRA